MADEKIYRPQKFPVYYDGVGEFKNEGGEPDGRRGSIARIQIPINNRPHEVVGVRIRNSYPRFPTPVSEGQEPIDEQGEDPVIVANAWNDGGGLCCLLQDLDDEQTVEIELAQQNVIVRGIHQRTLCGANGIHWHPFPCSYPFRGGNNMSIRIRRLQDYPFDPLDPLGTVIKPTAYVTVLGWMFVTDELPAGGPPSTDFNEPPQGATHYR